MQKEKSKGNIKYLIYRFWVKVGKEGSDITGNLKEETKTAMEVATLVSSDTERINILDN